MAKALKAAVIAFAVVFVIATLFPTLAPFAGAFGIGTRGIFLAATGSAVGAAFYAGLGAIASQFLVKKPGDLKSAISRLTISLNPQASGKWIFGETAFGTDLVYGEQHGSDDQFITHILAAAAHEVTSYGDLYVNDDLISFSGNAATGDYADTLWRQTRVGTESQTSILPISGDGLSWPLTADGLGIAHYQLRWQLGKDKIGNSIPSRITQVGKGAPVYDPRLDSTEGGSGAHRADDQSTWEYANGGSDIGANWALIVTFYLIGWRNNGELVFGMGIDVADIDYAQLIAAANICDETVDSKKRFKVGGILPTDNNHQSIMTQLEAAIGGSVSIQNGKWYVWAPNDDLSGTFNNIVEGDIIRDAGLEFIPSGPIEKLFNTTRGRYVEPAELYQPIYYPDVIESTAVTEDGRPRVMARDFAMIQDVSIAERVSRYMIRRSRFSGTWKFSMGPKGLIFRPFDITTLSCQETNNIPIDVRITAMTFNTGGVVQIECVEEDASIYDTSAALGTPITQNDPSAWDPSTQVSVTNFGATLITLSGSADTASIAYKVTWDDPGGLVSHTEAQLKIASDSEWNQVPSSSFGFVSLIMRDFEPSTLYDFRIRHVTIFGVSGPWTTVQDTTDAIGLTHFTDIPHYYRQSAAPSGIGEQDGDWWVDSDDNKLYRRISSVWTEVQDDDIGQALVDAAEALGQMNIFIQNTAPSTAGKTTGDIWINDTTYNPPSVPYAASMLSRFDGTAWGLSPNDIIGLAHVDALNGLDDADRAQTTADGKIVSFAQTTQPTADGVGDFWIDTDDNNKLYRWSGSAWVEYEQPGNLADASGTLQDIADGSTRFAADANQLAGGSRAFNALDSDSDYQRTIVTSNIIVVGSNPTNGLVIDNTGLRGYDGGVQQFNIPTTGTNITFKADIDTSGQMHSDGTTIGGVLTAAIFGETTNALNAGILGHATTGTGVQGQVTTGNGVVGVATGVGNGGFFSASGAGGFAIRILPLAGADGINLSGDIVGDAVFQDDITVTGISTFNSDVTIQGNSDLRVDRIGFFGTDGAADESSVVIGGTTGQTGTRTLVIKEGAVGGAIAGQLHLYGHNDGGQTVLGIVTERVTQTTTGSFSITKAMVIYHQNVKYYIGLSVAL